ncbi:MAG: hypothetical protein AB1564_07020 [Chloroflexota bacterium]
MATATETKSGFIAYLDGVLENPDLLKEARALLLLKVCQAALIFRPEVFEHFWPKLSAQSGSLNVNQQNEVTAMGAAKPSKKASHPKIVQEAMDAAEKALSMADSNAAEASRILTEAEERVNKGFWPLGKEPARVALIEAWMKVDRSKCIASLNRVSASTQRMVLQRLHKLGALSTQEWDLANRSTQLGTVNGVVQEILDQDEPVLHLSQPLAQQVGQYLLKNDAFAVVPGQASSDSKREKGIIRYIRMVKCVNAESADSAEALMEMLVNEGATTNAYADDWSKRFLEFRQLVNVWATFPVHREKAQRFLETKLPAHLREFAVAEWHGSIVNTPAEAEAAFQEINKRPVDCAPRQVWFLITLVRRGLEETALRLAQSSVQPKNVEGRVRRALVATAPDKAAALFKATDFEGDIVGQFLLMQSVPERVEFLREKTNHGKDGLPAQMWGNTNIMSMLSMLSALTGDKKGKQESLPEFSPNVQMRLYSKQDKPEDQFAKFINMHGYAFWGADELDPKLLEALVAWDEGHPDEIQSLMKKMWEAIKPDQTTLTTDLLRNNTFERCQGVMSAHPKSFTDLFVQHVKREIVDKAIVTVQGTTQYTFSLKPLVLFLNCVLAAQKVARFSSGKCGELIAHAVNSYDTTSELMMAAAELYTSDKGLDALKPPARLRNATQLKDWQFGVVQASMNQLLMRMIANQ